MYCTATGIIRLQRSCHIVMTCARSTLALEGHATVPQPYMYRLGITSLYEPIGVTRIRASKGQIIAA